MLRRAREQLPANARQALGQSVAVALRHARLTKDFKDRGGALRRSLRRGTSGPWVQFIRAGGGRIKQAIFVERGTKAHEIRPKRVGAVSSRRKAGKAMPPLLVFQIAGRWISKRVVHHPGTKATHFMEKAGEAGRVALLRSLERAADRAFLG